MQNGRAARHRNQRIRVFWAGIGNVAIHPLLPAMQQLRQRMLVMHTGRRHHSAVRQPALAVHADVPLQAEVPLLALAGLVHFWIAFLVGILRRTWRSMIVASTMVPLLSVMPLSYCTQPASANRRSLSWCCSSKWRNRSRLVKRYADRAIAARDRSHRHVARHPNLLPVP